MGARWYAVALLTAPLSTAAVLLSLSPLSSEFLPVIFTSDDKAPLLSTGRVAGLLWGAWHFILFRESGSFTGALPLAILLGRLFSWLPAYRVLVVWVYDRTGSLLVAMLMHVSLVASTVILEPLLTGGALLTFILVRAAALWVIVAEVAVTSRGHRERRIVGRAP